MTDRPRVRADCIDGPRPCPWITCRHHLKQYYPGPATCALDLADQGGLKLEEVGDAIGVTRQAVEQMEKQALRKIRGAIMDGDAEFGYHTLPQLPIPAKALAARRRQRRLPQIHDTTFAEHLHFKRFIGLDEPYRERK